MTIKKEIAVLLCAATVFSLAGCGSASTTVTADQNDNAFYV